jgi:tetratricopeptide (TPR) repeat protein
MIPAMLLHLARVWVVIGLLSATAAAQDAPALDPEFVSTRYYALIDEGQEAWDEGELEKAAKSFTQAISLAAGAGAAAEDLEVGSTIALLAGVREEQDQWDEAITLHNAAVDHAERNYGPSALDTLYAMQARGEHYWSRGYPKEAEEDHQKALDLLRRSDDPEAGDMATLYNSLGWDAWARGHFGRAIKLFEQGREKAAFADDDVSELWALIGIADSYYHWRQPERALQASEETLRQLRKAETDLELSATVYFCHGWLLDKLGRKDDAGPMFAKSLTMAKGAYDEDSTDYGRFLASAAAHDIRAGNAERGRERIAEALRIYERYYGAASSHVSDLLEDYADALLETGRLDDAQATYERMLEARKKALGEQSMWLAWPQAQLGSIALQQGKPDRALALAESALDLWRRHEAQDHDVIDTHLLAVRALQAQEGSIPDAAARAEAHRAAADRILREDYAHLAPTTAPATAPAEPAPAAASAKDR